MAVLIQAMWLATTPSRALHTCAARAHNIAGIRAVREAARSVPLVAMSTAHTELCANCDFHLAVAVVCVQAWLVASSCLRLHTSGETPGSVARGGLVRDAAHGASQVAISPCFTPGDSMVHATLPRCVHPWWRGVHDFGVTSCPKVSGANTCSTASVGAVRRGCCTGLKVTDFAFRANLCCAASACGPGPRSRRVQSLTFARVDTADLEQYGPWPRAMAQIPGRY